jgi:predicted phosphodiesterase
MVISDVHAASHYLRDVIRDYHRRYDKQAPQIWFLGDLFSRGNDPFDAQLLLERHARVWLKGNHDMLFSGELPLHTVDQSIQQSILSHRQVFQRIGIFHDVCQRIAGQQSYMKLSFEQCNIMLSHGGIPDTVDDQELDQFELTDDNVLYMTTDGYVWHMDTAYRTLRTFERLCFGPVLSFIGHTHERMFYTFQHDNIERPEFDREYVLSQRESYLICPGSVGDSRDMTDPYPSYAVLTFDENTPVSIQFHVIKVELR